MKLVFSCNITVVFNCTFRSSAGSSKIITLNFGTNDLLPISCPLGVKVVCMGKLV